MTTNGDGAQIHELIDQALLNAIRQQWFASEGPPDLEQAEKAHLAAFMLGGRIAERRPDVWVRYFAAHDDVPAVSAMLDMMIQQLLELAGMATNAPAGLPGQAPTVDCQHPRVDKEPGGRYVCEDCKRVLD